MRLTIKEINELIQMACDRNGRPDIRGKIVLRWSGRMTRAMGKASKKARDHYYTITLSDPLFERATIDEQKQTVVHEACHVIDAVISGRMSHGPTWKRTMRMAGVEAKRCHNVDRTGLQRAGSTYVYRCMACSTQFPLGPKRHSNMQAGRTYLCGRCRNPLVFVGVADRRQLA